MDLEPFGVESDTRPSRAKATQSELAHRWQGGLRRARAPSDTGPYIDRAAGGHCDHRDFGGPAATGAIGSEAQGAADCLPEQSQAIGPSPVIG
jgi:hypothetical protein